MNLLLVEDDLNLGKALVKVLSGDHQITWLRTLTGARRHLDAAEFDVVLLDLGLPDGDGRVWLRALRAQACPVPVLILSARDELGDRVEALDMGADDYLVKPFEVEELKARVRALVRRRAGASEASIVVGDLCYLPGARQFLRDGVALSLTPKEQRLLEALMLSGARPVSRGKLMQAIGAEVASNTLEVHIHSLRRHLGRNRIETVRGFGYRLVEQ